MERRVKSCYLLRMLSCCGLFALAAPVLGQAAKPAAVPPLVGVPSASVFQTPVGPGQLALVSLTLSETASLSPRGLPTMPGRTRHTARGLSLSWELVGPPDWLRQLNSTEEFLAQDEFGNVYRWSLGAFRSSDSAVEREAPSRLQLSMLLHGLDLRARRLASLRGALLFHESAIPLKVDLPFTPEGPPVTQTAEGRQITLSEMRSSASTLEFTLKYRGAGGKPSAWRDEVERLQLRVVDGAGTASSHLRFIPQYREGEVEIRCLYLERPKLPVFIRVEGLLLSEKLVRVPVVVRNLAFPRLDDPQAARDTRPHSIRGPKWQNGISLRVTRGAVPAGAGIVSLQFEPKTLPPRTAFGMGWVDVPTDRQGRIRLRGLRPGEYRVTRQWRSNADPAAPPVTAPALDLRIPEEGEVTLPDFDLRPLGHQ